MVRQRLAKYAFYKYRYAAAYTVFGLALATMLLVAGFYLPGGLTQSEIKSALVSDHLDPALLFSLQPDQLVYLPYRLVQAGSIALFGITIFSIKLPSIVLGFISAIGLLYLLNLWYKRNVAIIVAIIAVTTNQFLLASQAGQAGIMYIFLTTMILIAASMITRQGAYAKTWTILGFILAAISLYMPLNIYVLLALLLTAVIHPHARHLIVRKSSKTILAIGTVVALVIISPLAIGAFHNPSILLTLLGIPESFSQFGHNANMLFQNYIQFANPSTGTVITPVYGLGLAALIVLGLYRLFSAKYTTKSYIISFWLLALIPLVCLNPGFVTITFVPVVLLIALAIDYLTSSWYKLFPLNPYARVFGLVPLGVLLIGLTVSNVDRYVYGLHYDKDVYASYDYDLDIVTKKLRTLPADSSVHLVVSKQNEAFYQSFATHQQHVSKLHVTTNIAPATTAPTAIVERGLARQVNKLPSEILVTRTSQSADRFYLYKND